MSSTVVTTVLQDAGVHSQKPDVVDDSQGGASLSEAALTADVRTYEYTSAANPSLPEIPVLIHSPQLHESGTLECLKGF